LKECKKVPIDTLYVFDSSIVLTNENEYLKNIDLTKNNISKELIDNFFNINSTAIQFKNRFNFELPYRIINENQLQTYLNAKYGSEINKRWVAAGGVKYFSRVGFSNDKTEALICYKGYGGPLAASCYLIHMKKDRKCWKIVNEIQLWIS
jgi:hypothetical protein